MKPCKRKIRIPVTMSGKWFFIWFVVILLAASSAYSQRIESISGSRFRLEPVTYELESVDFGNLSFSSSSYVGGELTIRTSNVSAPTVTYSKVLKADSKTQAEDFAGYITVEAEQLENELAISVETRSAPPWRGTNYAGHVHVVVELPENRELKIFIRSQLYSIDITGPFASVEIDNSFGVINISEISSKVKVTSENSSVKIQKCSGPVTVRTSTRPIVLIDVDSKLGTIKLRNSNARIELESVRGEIDARTSFAPISGSEVAFESGRSKLRTENSSIKITSSLINGDLYLINYNGKIDLSIPDNSSARYSLQVDEGGRIYTKEIPINVDVVKRTLLTGFSGSKQHKVDIDMRGIGTINLVGMSTENDSD